MVKLVFQVEVSRPIEEVFGYFARFETIEEWDPNVRSSKLVREAPGQVGS